MYYNECDLEEPLEMFVKSSKGRGLQNVGRQQSTDGQGFRSGDTIEEQMVWLTSGEAISVITKSETVIRSKYEAIAGTNGQVVHREYSVKPCSRQSAE